MIRYLLLSLLILSSPLAAVETFQTYHNSRFDYSIDYPANLLFPQGEAPNGDGQIFASADNEARMIKSFTQTNHNLVKIQRFAVK